jgi:hypothetical protein
MRDWLREGRILEGELLRINWLYSLTWAAPPCKKKVFLFQYEAIKVNIADADIITLGTCPVKCYSGKL